MARAHNLSLHKQYAIDMKIITLQKKKSVLKLMIRITILIDATLTSRKNDIFNLSVCLNDSHKKSTDTGKQQEKCLLRVSICFHLVFFSSL